MNLGREIILLIDDDLKLAGMLSSYLEKHGFTTIPAADGETGIALLKDKIFDLVLLDIMLPGKDGMDICRQIRSFSQVPIIMLTARGEESDRIVGLELGADDYLPKPFNSRELVARMRAVLRRAHPAVGVGKDLLRAGKIEINPLTRTVSRNGKKCELTSYQFDLLYLLAARAGRVLTRDQILDNIKGSKLEPFDRSIDVHISRIRAAIENDPRSPEYLLTVHGVGYQFAVPNQ
jgi:DNA-binding response OmpR family regulator